jgi:hypothetical protein
MQQAEVLDRFVPASVCVWIEQTYYARINAQAQLDAALADPSFYGDPAAHLALFNTTASSTSAMSPSKYSTCSAASTTP